MTGTPFALDQGAATACPVLIQNQYNPHLVNPAPQSATVRPPSAHHEQVVRLFRHLHGAAVTDLRDLTDPADRAPALLQAVAAGAPIIVGAVLPTDWEGHRRGTADLLIRGEDVIRADGTPGPVYHPVVIKDRSVLAASPPGYASPPIASFAKPALRDARPTDLRYRADTCSYALFELAHLWYVLAAAGFADPQPWGGVIGTDAAPLIRPGAIAWIDLTVRQLRTYSYTSRHPWHRYSPLQRYDHEHRFRVRVATRALASGDGTAEGDAGPVASPVSIPQCDRCDWQTVCWTESTDDLSHRIARAPLDPREILTLRGLGVRTVGDLATADVDGLLPDYLPLVAHRDGAESRLRIAAHRSRLIATGDVLERLTTGPIDLPSAPVEIDLDVEASARNRVYLWGFLVTDRREPASDPTYHAVYRFSPLTVIGERDLAEEAATWLKDFVESLDGVPALVWHYSSYEPAVLRRLARPQRSRAPSGLTWAKAWAADHFVDLLPIVKANLFGVDGLGLKEVARVGADFEWRDPTPGGLESQTWFAAATGARDPEVRLESQARILRYNEDDVRATAALRAWLRSLT